jgi:hypothetical protein
MRASTTIVALAARALPGGRVLALMLALLVSTGMMLVVADVPSKAQTASLTINPIPNGEVYPGQEYSGGQVSVNYSGTSPLTASVNYGDGTGYTNFDLTRALSHHYTAPPTYPATYTVTVVVTDGTGLMDTETATVVVKAPTGTLNLTKPADATLAQGQPYNLEGTVTTPNLSGLQGVVNFGDGTGNEPLTINQSEQTYWHPHTYVRPGTYNGKGTHNVNVTVADETGKVGTTSATVTAHPLDDTFGVTPPESKTVNEGYLYESQGTVDASNTRKYVDYGDGAGFEELQSDPNSGAYSLKHFYAVDGVYKVTVIAFGDNGSKGTATATAEVVPATPPPDTEEGDATDDFP